MQIEVAASPPLSHTDGRLPSLISEVFQLHAEVPLTRFLFEKQPTGMWFYRVTAQDGRVWKQDIDMSGSAPQMTFSAPAVWAVSACCRQGTARGLCTDLASNTGLTKIDIKGF